MLQLIHMAEAARHQGIIEPAELDLDYFGGVGYVYRWEVYRHSDDGVDFHQEVLGRLGLHGTEAVLDIGCGQGEFLEAIEQQGHEGPLVGFDFNHGLIAKRHYAADRPPQESSRIMYVLGDISSRSELQRPVGLTFRPGSFDFVIGNFVFYHAEDPQESIAASSQLLTPDGSLLVATSGPTNKSAQRRIEALLDEKYNLPPLSSYAGPYTTEDADATLPSQFEEVTVLFEHNATVTISAGDETRKQKVSAINGSIKSMQPGRYPGRPERDIVREVINQEVDCAIAQDGAFVETIHRKAYLCRGPRD